MSLRSPSQYTFDKSTCTEPFVAMVHGLAIFAALTNGWQFSFAPEAPAKIANIIDDAGDPPTDLWRF